MDCNEIMIKYKNWQCIASTKPPHTTYFIDEIEHKKTDDLSEIRLKQNPIEVF